MVEGAQERNDKPEGIIAVNSFMYLGGDWRSGEIWVSFGVIGCADPSNANDTTGFRPARTIR